MARWKQRMKMMLCERGRRKNEEEKGKEERSQKGGGLMLRMPDTIEVENTMGRAAIGEKGIRISSRGTAP